MMVKEQTIQDFMNALSSKASVPGGGGTSALAGALGNALGQMVINLTVGKKKYAPVEDELLKLLEQLVTLQRQLLELADEDERVFAPLAEAYRLPSASDQEREYKERVMEGNLLAASLVPLKIMEKSLQLLDILEILSEKGSVMVLSDVGVGVQMTRAALLGAIMNVLINTKSMKDRKKAEQLEAEANRISKEGTTIADRIYEKVLLTISV